MMILKILLIRYCTDTVNFTMYLFEVVWVKIKIWSRYSGNVTDPDMQEM